MNEAWQALIVELTIFRLLGLIAEIQIYLVLL